ncbi:MAG: hypothetical protein FWG64_00215, partial [Firmicutes bacterium]|nr:hypothetical protein [Bacillota bacterium]
MKNFTKMAIIAAVVGFTACTADTTPIEPVEIPEVLEEWDSENAENVENPAPITQTELIPIEENPRNPLRFLGDDNQHAWRFNENG